MIISGICSNCSKDAQIHRPTGLCEDCYIDIVRGY